MTKHWFWVLFCLFLALASFSCASKTETINPPSATVEQFGTEKLSMLKDPDSGAPIPCSSDATCEVLIDKDDVCIGGTACHNGFCSVLIFDDCCELDSDGKYITCPAFDSCGGDDDEICDDDNDCTNDKCNMYLFDGVCTHGSVELSAITCGVGACASTGTETCDDGAPGDTCEEGTPGAETCNGLDDDCDGVIDNGDNGCGGVCELDPEKDSACDGDDLDECEDDIYECDGINAVACSMGDDNAEACNGEDDDCDGETDEDFPIEMIELCLVGVGECQASGHMVCNEEEDGVVCDAVEGDPSPTETCDNKDNDCDNATDEDFTTKGQDCDSTDSDQCENGTYTCKSDGTGVECVNEDPSGVVEVCNGVDDDCDGTIDEGTNACGGVCELSHQPGAVCDGSDADLCSDDSYACNGINAVACSVGANNAETCNNADDDCDGTIDEGTNACGGVCELTNQPGAACDGADADLCSDDSYACNGINAVACSVGANNAESCNGVDDDCDSATDEDFTTKGQSCDGGDSDQCKNGTYTCKTDGSGVECVNEVPQDWPGYEESCNQLDDDCDNATDEDFTTKGQSCDGTDSDGCANGTYTCKGDGSGVECVNENPSGVVETCNQLDDDCDGDTDEGVLNACGSCGDIPAETCNNIDDDCDGTIDDGNPGGGAECGETDDGECELGTLVCEAGVLVCDGAVYSDDEICDELDNDCDSDTDEDDVCSTCNNPLGDLFCGDSFPGATDEANWPDGWLSGYSCKPLLNESGSEAVFVFNSDFGGLSVMVKPINIDPATADLDVFVLSSCSASSCLKYGNTSATWSPAADTDYFVVVDGYKGASGVFDLQVTCKETTCNDGNDNDADDSTDCADSDCVGKVGCL